MQLLHDLAVLASEGGAADKQRWVQRALRKLSVWLMRGDASHVEDEGGPWPCLVLGPYRGSSCWARISGGPREAAMLKRLSVSRC